MDPKKCTIALIAVMAVGVFLAFSPVRSLDDLVWICRDYPMQMWAFVFNAAAVVIGAMVKRWEVIYALAVFDLIFSAAGLFSIIPQ